jgi:hypothetical protein
VGVAVSLVCDDNVTMCGVWLEVGPPWRWVCGIGGWCDTGGA